MFKRESNEKLAGISDDEVIGEAVTRLLTIYYRAGGDKYVSDFAFVLTPEWSGAFAVELERRNALFRGQPPLKLIKNMPRKTE